MTAKIPDGLKESVAEAELALLDIAEQIKKAKAVGADVKELESEAESQKKQIELIKRVYEF